ncbi:MAG: C40 family peptidase [Thermocrispum sp.]
MPTSSVGGSARGRRIGATALVAATSAAGLLAFDGTAAAATSSKQSIYDAPNKVKSGNRVTFRGKLTTAGGTPLGHHKVDLMRTYNGSKWFRVSTPRTYSNGRVSVVGVKIKATAKYRWVFRGDKAHGKAWSRTQTVVASLPVNRRIVKAAAAQRGDPYRYGATGPGSFDCSGLTQYAHKRVGIKLPRTSRDQHARVRKISKSHRKPGDLLFFHDGGRVYHAAIYAGSNYMWTAPQSGQSVKKAKIYSGNYYVGRAW